jgi:hypothetical protein
MPKNEKPPTYSGETNAQGLADDPEAWIRRFELASTINEWDTDAAKNSRVGFYLTGEASVWYDLNSNWILTAGTQWNDVKREFLRRFRPVDFDEELEQHLRSPKQDQGESVRSYGDRYLRLYAQARPGHLDRDFCRKYWISGLIPEVRIEVMKTFPATFDEAVTAAIRVEQMQIQLRRYEEHDKGSKPSPHKGRSAAISAANTIADKVAGYREASEAKKDILALPEMTDQDLKAYQESMGTDGGDDLSFNDLVERIKAWQLYTKLYNDPTKVKAQVLKATSAKTSSSAVDRERSKPKAPSGGTRLGRDECAYCHKQGHWKRECPERKNRSFESDNKAPTTPSSTPTPARRVKAKVKAESSSSSSSHSESETSEDDRRILKTYQVKSKKISKALAGKRNRMDENDDTDPVGTKKKRAGGPRTKKLADPRVVEFIRNTSFPLSIVARHGADLGNEAKRAINEIWAKERQAKKEAKGKSRASAMLSHALVVSGVINRTPCTNLVIDPGASTTFVR